MEYLSSKEVEILATGLIQKREALEKMKEDIRHITQCGTVDSHRFRVRRKLHLSPSVNLTSFLAAL